MSKIQFLSDCTGYNSKELMFHYEVVENKNELPYGAGIDELLRNEGISFTYVDSDTASEGDNDIGIDQDISCSDYKYEEFRRIIFEVCKECNIGYPINPIFYRAFFQCVLNIIVRCLSDTRVHNCDISIPEGSSMITITNDSDYKDVPNNVYKYFVKSQPYSVKYRQVRSFTIDVITAAIKFFKEVFEIDCCVCGDVCFSKVFASEEEFIDRTLLFIDMFSLLIAQLKVIHEYFESKKKELACMSSSNTGTDCTIQHDESNNLDEIVPFNIQLSIADDRESLNNYIDEEDLSIKDSQKVREDFDIS